MKKFSIMLGLLFLIAMGTSAFTFESTASPAPTGIEGDKWYSFSSATGKFKMKFPAKPEISETKKDEATTYKAVAQAGSSTYFVGFTVHEIEMVEPYELAKVSLGAFNETLGGTVKEESDWNFKGNRGIQAKIAVSAQQNMLIEYRVLLVGQIQYQLVVIAPDNDFDSKTAGKFYKSFKLMK